jgi:membrane protein
LAQPAHSSPYVWVYYSTQIFLLGAEFTWVFAHRNGSRVNQPAA